MSRPFSINVAWIAASSLVENVTSILIFFLVARIVGTEAFGIAAMAFAFLFLGEFLVRDTVTEAIIERQTLEEGRLEATFAVLFGVALLVVLTLCLLAPLIARLYGEPDVAPLLMAGSPAILFIGASGVSTALLRRRQEFRTLAIRDALAVVVGGLVCLALALGGFGAWSLIAQRAVQVGTSATLSIVAAGWVPRRVPAKSEFALVRGLGPSVVLLRTTSLIITQTPTVALGYFANPVAVGLYALAFRLVEIVSRLAVFPLRGVAQSALADLRRRTGVTAHFFLDVTQITALLSFTAFAGLAVIAKPAVLLVIGPDWIGAAEILPYLCFAGAVNSLVAIQEAYVLSIDYLRRFLYAGMIEAAIGIPLIAVAATYGLTAAAAAVLARSLIAFYFRTRVARAAEVISWSRYLSNLATPFVVAVGMALAVGLWGEVVDGHAGDLVVVATSILLGTVCAVGLVVVVMPDTATRLLNLVRRRE